MKMLKTRRAVRIKNLNFQKLRNGLRAVIRESVRDQIASLVAIRGAIMEKQDIMKSRGFTERQILLSKEFNDTSKISCEIRGLNHTLEESICQCALCFDSKKDMIYYPRDGSWYCIDCHKEGRIWDPEKLPCAECGSKIKICPSCGEDNYCPKCREILKKELMKDIQDAIETGFSREQFILTLDKRDRQLLNFKCIFCGTQY